MERTRREFVRLAAFAAAAFAAGCAGEGADTTADSGAPPPPCLPPAPWPKVADVDLPHLGGAPDSDAGRTIAAFCDTVIPGAHRDPSGAPGAIDTGAPAMFFDPSLPALALAPLLAGFLDGVASARAGVPFWALPVEEREAALEVALAGLPLLGFAVQLARLAYFASEGAACHLGYPGPNPGYHRDPHFSFGVAMSSELTEDGNVP